MDHRNKKELKKSHSLKETAEPEINSGLKTIGEKKAGIFQVYDYFCEKKHGLMGYESLTKFLENVQCQKKVDCSGGDNKNENYIQDNIENDDNDEDKTQEVLHSVMKVSFFKIFYNLYVDLF